MTTESLSPTSIEISFYPPLAIDQNGPITSYNISYTGEIFDADTQFQVITITNPIYPSFELISVNITELQEYNKYTISARAINREGTSQYTAGDVQITDQGGSPYLLIYVRIIISNSF